MNMKENMFSGRNDLEKLGLKVLRFTTNDVENYLESVLKTIEKHLK